MATLSTILTTLTLLIYKTESVLTTCDDPFATDNCICVWGLQLTNTRPANGQYRLLPSPSPTANAAQDNRQWFMDDVTLNYGYPIWSGQCNTYDKIFWNINEYCGPLDIWWFGDTVHLQGGGCTGNCVCNKDNVVDPTSCPTDKLFCNSVINNQVSITFGRCPLLTDSCTHISITAPSPGDACNGIYIAADPPNNYDNEINIYTNINNDKYIYFDHFAQRWKCASLYIPCVPCTNGAIYYCGPQDNVGTPDPFQTVINTGDTWTVSDWGTVTATFECNPPTPAPVSSPTMDTIAPTRTPTNIPTTSPTNQPTISPTFVPTNQPTNVPSVTPSESPVTLSPTEVPTSSPTRVPTVSPTNNPLRPGDSEAPSEAPITPYPTLSPNTMNPSNSPSINPSVGTDTPTRSPLGDGETHAPSTSDPTEATPTERPTTITFVPSRRPTTAPSKNPTTPTVASNVDGDGDGNGDEGCMMRMDVVVLLIFVWVLLFG